MVQTEQNMTGGTLAISNKIGLEWGCSFLLYTNISSISLLYSQRLQFWLLLWLIEPRPMIT